MKRYFALSPCANFFNIVFLFPGFQASCCQIFVHYLWFLAENEHKNESVILRQSPTLNMQIFRKIHSTDFKIQVCTFHPISKKNFRESKRNYAIPLRKILQFFKSVLHDPELQPWNFGAIFLIFRWERAIFLKMWVWKILSGFQTLTQVASKFFLCKFDL